jgi:hypothetical protein
MATLISSKQISGIVTASAVTGEFEVSGSFIQTGSLELSGSLTASGEISASDFIGGGRNLTGIELSGRGIVSQSIQILGGTNIISGAAQLPTGTVSGSAQIVYADIPSTPDTAFIGGTNVTVSSGSGGVTINAALAGSTEASVTLLNAYTSSNTVNIGNIHAFTGSVLTTGYVSSSKQITDFGFISASEENTSLNAYTASNTIDITNLESTTASFDNRLDNVESTTTSLDDRLDQVETVTSSLATTYEGRAGASHTLISGAAQITSVGTITQDTVTFTSANSTDPLIEIKNTTSDTNGARLRFSKDKGSAGADGDIIGNIEFIGDDAGQTQTTFAKIVAQVSEADNTDEAGKLSLYVAESDGTTTTLTAGLVLEGEHATDGEVDVTIGAGASSTVTIPGSIDLAGDIDVDGTLETDALTIDGTAVASAGTTNITTLGTITTGVWNGTTIATAYIADNAITLAKMAGLTRGSIIYGDASGDPAALSVGSANTVLQSDGTDASWGTVTNSMLAGSIANSKLANDGITIGTADTSLGGTVTALVGLTDLDMTSGDKTILDTVGSNTLTVGAAGTTVVIPGNLTVNGTKTYISSSNLNIGDNILELNYAGTAADAGLLVKDSVATGTSGSFLWDASEDYWIAGALGSEARVVVGTGTTGDIVKFSSAGVVADSILSESGTTLTVANNVIVSGLTASQLVVTNGSKQLTSTTDISSLTLTIDGGTY